MTTQKTSTSAGIVSGILLAFTFFVMACNNSADKKGESADTPAAKPVEQITTPASPDTTGMDTADTRPVKTTD